MPNVAVLALRPADTLECLTWVVPGTRCPFPHAPVEEGVAPEETAARLAEELGLPTVGLAPCGWHDDPLTLLTVLPVKPGTPAPDGWTWRQELTDGWELALAKARQALPAALGRRPVLAVVGCRDTSPRFTETVQRQARLVGAHAADLGWTVLTGGLTGTMELPVQAARAQGGLTVGILPGSDPREANRSLELVLPSGIGYARNYLTALAGDAMVALNGGRGTLEEMLFALDFGRPVLSWGSWRVAGVDTLDPADAAGMRHWLQRRLAEFYRMSAGGPAQGGITYTASTADHRDDLLEEPSEGDRHP